MGLPLKSHGHRLLRGVLSALALPASIAIFLAVATETFAQTDLPDAPTDVAVYTYSSGKLEVRWSSTDAESTDSFKIQWKSGSEEFDSSRQNSVDPATWREPLQSTSAGERYKYRISGLTNGAEYTVRVIATNTNGDSDPSDEETGTPQSSPGQEREFIENEVIELFESSAPWLREVWDYVIAENVPVDFNPSYSRIGRSCQDVEDGLKKCKPTHPFLDGVQVARPNFGFGGPLRDIAHELAHVYTLANGIASAPAPLGVAHIYFNQVNGGLKDQLATYGGDVVHCRARELYADGLTIVALGEGFVRHGSYWNECSSFAEAWDDTAREQALAVVRSAAAGEMPSWFADTYNDANGNPDLERVWADLKGIGIREDLAVTVFQLHNSFGGYCDNRKATESAFESGVTRNPWKDGGCVPDAPPSASATAVGTGKLGVSWDDSVYDGGSPMEGYKVRWKSGTQEYSSSRQATVTDFTDLHHTITGLTFDQSHTIRVMAYNHNGDGAAAETTATPTATDTSSPELLAARIGSDHLSVRLTYNEELDESSEPPLGAFTLAVNGISKTPRVYIRGNVVALNFAIVGGAVKPTDVVTVSYTAPTGEAAKPLRDSAGNTIEDFTNQAVRNDKSKITFTSDPGPDTTYSWNDGSGSEDVIEVTVTFSEPVLVTGVPKLRFRIGSNTRRAAYHSGSGTSSLIFRYKIAEGETDTDGISVYRGTIEGMIRYSSTKAVAPGWVRTDPWAIFPVHYVDGVRPFLVSADILANGTDLELRWDDTLDEDSVPTTSDPGFEVLDTLANTSRGISAISVQGRVVTLTLSSTVSPTDRLTVSYDIPSSNPIKDAVGNYAESTSSSVSITQNPNSPPVFPTTEDGARSVAENTPAGAAIGLPVAAGDSNGDMLTYTLGGPDAEYFDIVESTGQMEVGDGTVLDHEARSSYTVEVAAANDSGATAVTTVTVTVTNVEEEGTLTLSPVRPSVDTPVSATLSDPDGDVSYVIWRWARDSAMGGTFDDIITGARGKSYTPVDADIDMYLKATAGYTDGHGAGKNAIAVSDHAVTGGDPLVARYDGNGNGMIDKVEVIAAINDYLFGGGAGAISKSDVIKLINLYLFG